MLIAGHNLLGYLLILQEHSLGIKYFETVNFKILAVQHSLKTPTKETVRLMLRYALLETCTFVKPASPSKVLLTITTSMGIGTGSLALYLSFNSFTMNTNTMISMDITRSQMLVEVIWIKMFFRVCAKESNTVYSTRIMHFAPEILEIFFSSFSFYNQHCQSNRWLCLQCFWTHMYNSKCTTVAWNFQSQHKLELGNQDVDGSCCGEAGHQSVRQVYNDEAHL